jgi:hypothetical protein
MARHELPDDSGNPQIPELPESLRRKLEQAEQTPIYRVDKSGQGRLESPTAATSPDVDNLDNLGGDLMPLIMGVQQLCDDLIKAVDGIPDVKQDGVIQPEKLDLSTRLAIIHAGNAIDYAVRRVEDIGRERRILKLRSELAHEMRAGGLQGDPANGMTPV